LLFKILFRINFDAANWTLEEIAALLPHVKVGGVHFPAHCTPRYAGTKEFFL